MSAISLAVHKFASCDGCQLSVLALEDELLALGEVVAFTHFAEASSGLGQGPFHLSLVEGSVSTPHHLEKLKWIREQSRWVVSIGACATTGGVQALRNFARVQDFLKAVYARPEYIETLAHSTPVARHTRVDFELQGCPVNKQQLKEVILAFAQDRPPNFSRHSVCLECKLRGTVCLMVAGGGLCLGPVTQAGCGAICPAYGRGCYGCFGPATPANVASFTQWVKQEGHDADDLGRAFRHITGNTPAHREGHGRTGEAGL